MNTKLKDPCILCLVRGCCERREDKCQLLRTWNHRHDWIRTLIMSICAVPLAMFTFICAIAFGISSKEEESFYDDY